MYETTAPIGTASDFSNINDTIGYGVELGVIMRKTAKNVPVEKAMDYVFGYTIINDLTARELGPRHHGPFMSKSPDGYMPMGPWIVTKDEFDRIPHLGIRARVNGDLRQGSTTERVTFLPDYIIADLTRIMTLRPATVISTGSPRRRRAGLHGPQVPVRRRHRPLRDRRHRLHHHHHRIRQKEKELSGEVICIKYLLLKAFILMPFCICSKTPKLLCHPRTPASV